MAVRFRKPLNTHICLYYFQLFIRLTGCLTLKFVHLSFYDLLLWEAKRKTNCEKAKTTLGTYD